ncbi:hypothetical protein [Pseudomonas sp. MWU12-2323]|uniref:hypothetical protein n=1 Tax=Pseudomonas sp. MWU12-2323 TaxID=2651296 RepID=UPI00128CFBBF|nr:hypothetical protein [Pseudomonas sp. MWU12-2323]MPQ69497.1 hypothetical protein [Pseudomonas sp. MWU12-2323]
MESIHETLNPSGFGQQDEFTDWMRSAAAGFVGAKRLPDGTYCGVLPLIFTYAICLGVTYEAAYQKRFCYKDTPVCLHEYSKLASFNDEPKDWVARRPQVLEVIEENMASTTATNCQEKKHPAGTAVRFSESYLSMLAEKERRRYQGREGKIRGYRLQDDPKPRPIVFFEKFGRYKEEVFFEMPWTDIELVVQAVI